MLNSSARMIAKLFHGEAGRRKRGSRDSNDFNEQVVVSDDGRSRARALLQRDFKRGLCARVARAVGAVANLVGLGRGGSPAASGSYVR